MKEQLEVVVKAEEEAEEAEEEEEEDEVERVNVPRVYWLLDVGTQRLESSV